jgi:aldose 1-epimerase
MQRNLDFAESRFAKPARIASKPLCDGLAVDFGQATFCVRIVGNHVRPTKGIHRMNLFKSILLVFLSLRCASTVVADPTVQTDIYGKLSNGQVVKVFTLRNTQGMQAKVIEYGATIIELLVPDRNNKYSNVILAADSLEGFEKGFPSASIIGRYANRIRGAKFSIDGKEYHVTKNAGENHIHGGKSNFAKVVWKGQASASSQSSQVVLNYVSQDGEEGFPGTLNVTVTYTLTESNELKIGYQAKTDKPTVVNLTNHVYFNLSESGSDVLGHLLQINAEKYTASDKSLIPTGEIASVKGTALDFLMPHAIGERIEQTYEAARGYDHNFILLGPSGTLRTAAKVVEPKSGRTLECLTTEPGVQLYTANGFNNNPFPRHGAFCLETQHYPDSPNQTAFPTTVVRPEKDFQSETVFRFSK